MSIGPSNSAVAPPAPSTSEPVWLADSGNGIYRNPVLFADYSDPDAIRVGDDFWLTASSFGHVPGLPILHSRDLVNWTLVNHALPQLLPTDHFSMPRHGEGVWAPAIRHHEGKFWIYYPDPDFGLYAINATDPRGVWSQPVLVKKGRGLIDPCPFWDDDGTGYLIHGWAKSRAGIKNRLTLHRLAADNFSVVDEGKVVIDGDTMEGWSTIEGPKLYRRGGYYYVFAPAGGVTAGYQAVFRARSLDGPYENRIVLARGSTSVNGPHQGAWVSTPTGDDWFLHFQELPAYGRVVHLQPMRWNDDWPVIGSNVDGDGTGEPVLAEPLPLPRSGKPTGPLTTDEFDAPKLGLQWQWQANPRVGWASLKEKPGSLRLHCVPLPAGKTYWSAGNLLMQKFPAPAFEVTTALDFFSTTEDEVAGLMIFGCSYTWIGVRKFRGKLHLVLNHCQNSDQGGAEQEIATMLLDPGKVYLRASVNVGGRCQFSFSTGGEFFSPLGDIFQATSSYWVGAKVGLFASRHATSPQPPGFVDVDWFRVTPLST